MTYKPRTLFRIIQEINTSLYLPHIQRPFVWDEDQMRRLLDSLMRSYPIQTLLFWRTKDEIRARRFMTTIAWNAELHEHYDRQKSEPGIEKTFVLDGQQRIQTLYALFAGAIESPDGKSQLDAYLDVTSGHTLDDEGLLYSLVFSAEPRELPFYRLRNLLTQDAQRNAFDIGYEVNQKLDASLNETPERSRDRQKLVMTNFAQLLSILFEEKHFWVEELDGVASHYPYKKILDIFVRVNSGGTKLDAADLMFAAMKEGWFEVEEKVEGVANLLNSRRLTFDKDFVLKCLVVAHGKGAQLDPEKLSRDEGLLKALEADWPKAEATFQQLRDFVDNELQLYSDKVIRSYGSFVPLFDYLYHNPKPIERNRVLMRAYYYKSQLFNWYGAQTDNIINVMHGIVGRPRPDGFPIGEVKAYFADSRKTDVELRKEHLLNMRLRFILLNLIYVERFGKSPFNVCFWGNEPAVDHIYPRYMLEAKLQLGSADVNHLGNYRFVGSIDNIRKRAELPASYFTRLKQAGIDIENHLLLEDVSKDPSLLLFDQPTYFDFRDRRLTKIFEICDRIVNAELH